MTRGKIGNDKRKQERNWNDRGKNRNGRNKRGWQKEAGMTKRGVRLGLRNDRYIFRVALYKDFYFFKKGVK